MLLTPGNTYEFAVTLRSASALAAVTSSNTGADVIPIAIGTVTGSHACIGYPTEMSLPTLGNRRFSLLFTHAAP